MALIFTSKSLRKVRNCISQITWYRKHGIFITKEYDHHEVPFIHREKERHIKRLKDVLKEHLSPIRKNKNQTIRGIIKLLRSKDDESFELGKQILDNYIKEYENSRKSR